MNKQKRLYVLMMLMVGWLFIMPIQAFAAVEDVGHGEGGDRIQYDNPQDTEEAWFNLFDEWEKFLVFILAFGLLTSILIFIVLMVKLSQSGDNPFDRRQVLGDIFVLLVTTAILGSFGVFFAVVVGIFS